MVSGQQALTFIFLTPDINLFFLASNFCATATARHCGKRFFYDGLQPASVVFSAAHTICRNYFRFTADKSQSYRGHFAASGAHVSMDPLQRETPAGQGEALSSVPTPSATSSAIALRKPLTKCLWKQTFLPNLCHSYSLLP